MEAVRPIYVAIEGVGRKDGIGSNDNLSSARRC